MTNHKGSICAGTSGWHYQHWKGKFYPKNIKDKDMLKYYCQFFSSLELNNSFYRLPSEQQFEDWFNQTPEDFIFSIKASRYITHIKRLLDPKESINKLLTHLRGLGDKLGPILFQLPPNLKLNKNRLSEFLQHLPTDKYRFAFEFRDSSWYNKEIYQILEASNCAFCIYELNKHQSPIVSTSNFIYIRLHGPDGKYSGDYSEKELEKWEKRIKQWTKEGKDVYIYFDNDQNAYATFNALSIKESLEKKRNKKVLQK